MVELGGLGGEVTDNIAQAGAALANSLIECASHLGPNYPWGSECCLYDFRTSKTALLVLPTISAEILE
jgi:hypothetical protein